MADDCEVAQDLTDRWLAGQIAKATEIVPGGKLLPKGCCHWCEDKVDDGLLFCPPPDKNKPGCRDDWQRYHKHKERTGGI